MSESIFTKAKRYPWKKAIKRLLFETPVEVMIGVLLVGAISGPLIYRNRAARAGEIPTAFSEIEQTTKDFARQGKPVPPNTKYYSYANDIPAKVFESSNIAFTLGNSHFVFAKELQTRVNASYQKHPLLSTYAEEMPQAAADALQSMHKLVGATKEMPAIRQAFEDAWTESHVDHTKTKRWTTRECNSEGKNCRTVSHSKQVYDYTIHTYTFHPDHARRAALLLNDFVARNPDLTVEERLYLARETHAENEEAIAKSMKRQLDGKTPTEEEYKKLANTWASGSNFAKYQPGITSEYAELSGLVSRWNKALGTAQDVRKRTNSHADSGPYEYRLAESAKGHGGAIIESSHHIVDGIRFTQAQATALNDKIKEYVGVVLDHKPGDADQLRSDIMKTAREIYWQNYENGFDVQPFKWLEVILLTMLCMAAGGAAGFGVDRLLNARRREWYDNDDSEDGDRLKRDVDADFNRRSETSWTRQPEQQAPIVKTEPEPPPAPEKAPGWNWTPKPPTGVDVSPPLPEPRKPAEETQKAGNDNADGVQDDPAKREKWIKKYKDISP
ncbi:MAG: hypothetical protein EPN97_11370 [Alphaproteobacteria bacterium]|nr:MAG: hypothetical protein EPN97_11370 [Alphaproteobacteria bacterium]